MLKRGLLGYLPVNAAQALAGFGAIVVFTRLLSPSDFGAYALAFSVTSLVHTCVFTWLEAAMARFTPSAKTAQDRADLSATLLAAYAALAVATPVAAAVVAVSPLTPNLKWAIAIGLACTLLRSLVKLAQERRRAEGEVMAFAAADIVQTAGAFLIGAALAVAGLGAPAPLAGAGAASALVLLPLLPAELRRARGGRVQRARLSASAAYGLPIALSLVMALALATTDRFVIAGWMNEAAVGAYHAGYTLSSRTLDVIFIWLGMAGGPAAAAALERAGPEAMRRVARDQATLMLLIALPAAAGLAMVARPLAEVMVGPALAPAAGRVTPWIAVGALLSGLTTYYFNTAFTLSRRTGRLFTAMAIAAVSNLFLALALIPRFGLDGAVWATAGGYGVGLGASAWLGRGALALPIPWRALGGAAAATAAMAGAVARLPSPGGAAELALKAGVGAAVYALAVLALDAGGARSWLAEALQAWRARASAVRASS